MRAPLGNAKNDRYGDGVAGLILALFFRIKPKAFRETGTPLTLVKVKLSLLPHFKTHIPDRALPADGSSNRRGAAIGARGTGLAPSHP